MGRGSDGSAFVEYGRGRTAADRVEVERLAGVAVDKAGVEAPPGAFVVNLDGDRCVEKALLAIVPHANGR